MREKLKASGLLLLTLLVGVLLGVAISRATFEDKVKRFGPGHKPFKMKLLNKIDATDAQQKQLEPILEKYDSLFIEMRQRHVKEMREVRASIKKDIAPLLTEEQKKRLDRDHKRRPRDGRPMGPPKGF